MHKVLSFWGNAVANVSTPLGIKSIFYPQTVATHNASVGKTPGFCTTSRMVLPCFFHGLTAKKSSVRGVLFHTIHTTYYKALLNKFNFCY